MKETRLGFHRHLLAQENKLELIDTLIIATSVVVAALIIRSGSQNASHQRSAPVDQFTPTNKPTVGSPAPSLPLPLPVHYPVPIGGPRNKEFIAIPKVCQSEGAMVAEWRVCFIDGLSIVEMKIMSTSEWARDRLEDMEEMASKKHVASDHKQ